MGSTKPGFEEMPTNSAQPLRPIRFSTRDLPVASQFDAWRTFMASAIELELPGGTQDGFAAEQSVWDLGRFALTRSVMPSAGYMRSWRHLRRGAMDHWCIVLVCDRYDDPVSGRRARPTTMHIRSLGESFEANANDGEVISLYMPRDAYGRNSVRFERLAGDLGRSAPIELLADYIMSLERRVGDCRIGDIPALVQATEAMISACLVSNADEIDAARDVLTLSLAERAKRIIRGALFSPDLTPEFLARSIGISRSGLYRLFEPFGGVRNVIQRERLFAARTALANPAREGSIVEIAERCGFGDASAFSRAFRREFGITPSEVRVSAAIGAPVGAIRTQPVTEGADLAGVLSRLQT
ncbi:hypothetical protein C3941_15985 [Kaistia algarum]|nr:hypothetical protein C3941_15985 [Kaistia algarum]